MHGQNSRTHSSLDTHSRYGYSKYPFQLYSHSSVATHIFVDTAFDVLYHLAYITTLHARCYNIPVIMHVQQLSSSTSRNPATYGTCSESGTGHASSDDPGDGMGSDIVELDHVLPLSLGAAYSFVHVRARPLTGFVLIKEHGLKSWK